MLTEHEVRYQFSDRLQTFDTYRDCMLFLKDLSMHPLYMSAVREWIEFLKVRHGDEPGDVPADAVTKRITEEFWTRERLYRRMNRAERKHEKNMNVAEYFREELYYSR
jgi:hypothetical protein